MAYVRPRGAAVPHRIQRRRTKGWKMPEGAMYVGRPSGWGNPYKIEQTKDGFVLVWDYEDERMRVTPTGKEYETKRQAAVVAVRLYRTLFMGAEFDELCGKDLACWCHLCDAHKDGKPLGAECPDCDPCHVDVLLSLANQED